LSEKKQTFNEYKTQRGVEEKEEERRQGNGLTTSLDI